MKSLILSLAATFLVIGAQAGDWGKAPVPAKAPIEECLDIGGSISAGYATDFIFQGARHGRDTVWTDVNYTFDSIVPITLGATYHNITTGLFENFVFDDFLHTYAQFDAGSIAGFDTTLSYNHIFFPEGSLISSQALLMLDLRRDLGFADLLLGTSYSAGGSFSGGWYHHAGLEKTFGITDNASLVLGAGVGYSDNYWVHAFNTGWTNYYVTASLPIELNCRTTLTPYIGYNGGMDAEFISSDGLFSAGGGDVLHGGVSLSVKF